LSCQTPYPNFGYGTTVPKSTPILAAFFTCRKLSRNDQTATIPDLQNRLPAIIRLNHLISSRIFGQFAYPCRSISYIQFLMSLTSLCQQI